MRDAVSGGERSSPDASPAPEPHNLALAVLDALPVLVSYLDRDERYRFANAAYAGWFMRPVGEIVGHTAQEVMPPAVYARNKPNIDRVLAGKVCDYEAELPYPAGLKHVRVRLIPDGAPPRPRGFFGLVVDDTDRRRAEAAALESEARLRSITANLPSTMVYQMGVSPDGATRRFLYLAETCLALNGVTVEAALSDSGALYSLIHPDDLPAMLETEAAAIRDGTPFDHVVRFRRPDGGFRWCRLVSARRPLADGGAIWDGVQIDVSEQRRAEERQALLVNELNHRVKNTLAAVQSLAAQTARSKTEPAAFAAALNGRLRALSQAQDLLTRTEWTGVELGEIVGLTLAPYADQAYWSGPAVALRPSVAVGWSLVVHELATNAAKYGALAQDGRVAVAWTVDNHGIDFSWTERGGPSVSPPARRGFGARLIERTVRQDLNGEVAFDFAQEGLRCEIRLPLALERGSETP